MVTKTEAYVSDLVCSIIEVSTYQKLSHIQL